MTHRGFTLLELLVVLSIVGIATALSVPAISSLDREAAPATVAADEISKLLRTTRRTAMERGAAAELTIEPSRGRYQVWVEDESEESFEGSIEFPEEFSVSGGGSDLRFTFDPLGMGRGPPITLRGPGGAQVIRISGWTGRVVTSAG